MSIAVAPIQKSNEVKTVKPKADLILDNAAEVLTCVQKGAGGIGRISGGSVAVAGERILAVGSTVEVRQAVDRTSAQVFDVCGKVVAPGFVDCHTHLIFGKSRVKEYALRMTRTVLEMNALDMPIGIPASVLMTRDESEDQLFKSALDRLGRMLRYGTTTVESKSGYGLTPSDELKQLYVNQRLQAAQPIDIVSTFLGAHDFPPEIDRNKKAERNRYIDALINEMIPEVKRRKLAEYIDVYCDDGYYTVEESRRILKAGIVAGLGAKIHTDAYSCIGGSQMAADLPAVSVEHLNYTTREEMANLARAGVIGVVLPALDFAVAHPRPFNARAMLEAGMTLALGTNLNPGNWTESMQFVMMLACRCHRMSPQESLLAATLGAAKAIGREEIIGTLEVGKLADIQIWDLPTFEDVIYRLGNNSVASVIKRGKVCFSRL